MNNVKNNCEFPNPFPLDHSVCPTDEDLISYLTLKIFGMPFPDPINRFRPLHIYDHSPHQLYELYRTVLMESEMYKFQLDRNRREGNYFSRKAGEGYWKFHGSEPIIMDETTVTIRHVKHTEGKGPFSSTIRYVRLMTKGHCNGRPYRKDIVKGLVRGKHMIGYKTRFVYYKGEAKHGTKTNWVMDEYRVNENYLPNSNKMENLVLCKIYRNRKRKGSTSF